MLQYETWYNMPKGTIFQLNTSAFTVCELIFHFNTLLCNSQNISGNYVFYICLDVLL